jgi:iron complex transport system ATP-binding protein
MDEPTANLDFGNQALVLRRIIALRAQGLAVVLSTHDPGQAFACATAVALLHQGGLRAIGPPAEVIEPDRLAEVYGVRVSVARLPDGRLVCAPELS